MVMEFQKDRPIYQTTMPGNNSGPFRTNYMQDFFFLQRQSNYWVPCGYFLGGTSISTNESRTATNAVYQVGVDGVGNLYRLSFLLKNEYGEAAPSLEYDTNILTDWMQQFRGVRDTGKGYFRTNANLLAEGVVHFAIRCYDNAGQFIEYTNYYRPNQPEWDRVYRDPMAGNNI